MGERRYPSVDKLARSLGEGFSERARVKAAREAIAEARAAGEEVDPVRLEELVAVYGGESLKPLINMSGVILHTGLGRARLAPAVVDHVARVAAGHSCLEFDLGTGERGNRQDHVRWLLRELTGAEDAYVVNNCAGAVVLALSALCSGREVVLSRGQMVEIGGAFRMPDVIRESGCRLVECGCTNKTHLRDYEAVSGEETGAWMRCHPSNFKMSGFVASPSSREMAEGAHKVGALFLDDVGSGCLVDTVSYALPKERTLAEAVSDGADVVMASGDKLLGGPQAGIVLGSSAAIGVIKKHPLARALRCDKLTLAGLEATLRLYFEGREREIPAWKYAARALDEVKKDALKLKRAWSGAVLEPGLTEMGSGSMPGAGVETVRVGLPVKNADAFHRCLRLEGGVVGRIENGVVYLDPRTAEPDEVRRVAEFLKTTGQA